jgi:hypothetical protein
MTTDPAHDDQWRPPKLVDINAGGLASGDDIERTLRAAEELYRQSRGSRQHEQNVRLTLLSLLGAAVLSVVGSTTVLLTRGLEFDSPSGFISFISLAIISNIVIVLLYTLRRRATVITANLDLDVQRACDMARLVEEVYVEVGRRENWSVLRYQATELRLSSFPLKIKFFVRKRPL